MWYFNFLYHLRYAFYYIIYKMWNMWNTEHTETCIHLILLSAFMNWKENKDYSQANI